MRLTITCPSLPSLLTAVLLICAPCFGAQQPVSSSAPDAQSNKGIVTIQAALLALNAQPIARSEVRGSIEDEKGTSQGDFDWRTAGPEYQFDVHRGDHMVRFDTNGGKPNQSRDGKESDAPPHQLKGMIPVHLPSVLLLQEIKDQKWNVEYLGQESYRETSAWHVRVTDQTDRLTKAISVQDWWFDTTTGLPLKLETRLPDKGNALQHETDVTRYLNWSSSDAGSIPSKISKCESDSCKSIFRVESVDITAGGQQ